MSSMVYVPPAQTPTIKSIQRGVLAAGSAATVSAVNTAKSVLLTSGFTCISSPPNAGDYAKAVLTDSTTVTATCGYFGNAPSIAWQLLEYN
ncbi:MAG: hypothetical protein K8H84_07835 [Sulfuricella denitrificans]|nr:hypothetical protein [Sulfuricella denitrificans]